MLLDLTVSGNVTINASSEKVWNVLTNPEVIREYLFGTNTVTDWAVGSPIVFQGEYNGLKYRDHGEILTNVPLEKLSYSYWSNFTGLEDKPENYSTVTYTIDSKGDDLTQFTWSQKGFANEDSCKHSQQNMSMMLNQIKAIAERE